MLFRSWFGARDALKLTAFAGNSGTRLAYLAASEADVKADPRVNPLSDQEGDRFHQEMVSAQYSHAFSDRLTATAMAYRNSAAGAYDVSFGMAPGGGGLSIANYGLAHVWYGSTAALTWSARELSLAAGVTATDYHRDHWMAMRPALTSREYTNTGVKRETAAFAKLASLRPRFLLESARLDGWLSPRRWTVPTLVQLAGREKIIDNIATRRWVRRRFKGPRKIVEYPRAFHTLEFEADDSWRRDLLGWLDSIAEK